LRKKNLSTGRNAYDVFHEFAAKRGERGMATGQLKREGMLGKEGRDPPVQEKEPPSE